MHKKYLVRLCIVIASLIFIAQTMKAGRDLHGGLDYKIIIFWADLAPLDQSEIEKNDKMVKEEQSDAFILKHLETIRDPELKYKGMKSLFELLCRFIKSNYKQTLTYFIERLAAPGAWLDEELTHRLLICAAGYGRIECLRMLLTHFEVQFKKKPSTSNLNEALIAAIMNKISDKTLDCIDLLISQGADVDHALIDRALIKDEIVGGLIKEEIVQEKEIKYFYRFKTREPLFLITRKDLKEKDNTEKYSYNAGMLGEFNIFGHFYPFSNFKGLRKVAAPKHNKFLIDPPISYRSYDHLRLNQKTIIFLADLVPLDQSEIEEIDKSIKEERSDAFIPSYLETIRNPKLKDAQHVLLFKELCDLIKCDYKQTLTCFIEKLTAAGAWLDEELTHRLLICAAGYGRSECLEMLLVHFKEHFGALPSASALHEVLMAVTINISSKESTKKCRDLLIAEGSDMYNELLGIALIGEEEEIIAIYRVENKQVLFLLASNKGKGTYFYKNSRDKYFYMKLYDTKSKFEDFVGGGTVSAGGESDERLEAGRTDDAEDAGPAGAGGPGGVV